MATLMDESRRMLYTGSDFFNIGGGEDAVTAVEMARPPVIVLLLLDGDYVTCDRETPCV